MRPQRYFPFCLKEKLNKQEGVKNSVFYSLLFILSGYLALNFGKTFVEERPIAVPTEAFKTESARPSGQPLGGAEGRNAVASPAGVEHCLVLRAGGTDTAVYVLGAVGDALAGVAPECNGTLAPLLESGYLVKLEEGEHVAERVLVHCLMRCGNAC